MAKKIFIGLVIALVILIIALGAYFFFFTPKGETGSGDFSFSKFFPFGQSSTRTSENVLGNVNGEENVSNVLDLPVPQIRKISETQIAGFTLIDTASSTLIRYIERGTGHIYEASANTLSQKRISNTTVPKIYEALWVEKGDSLILRYLKSDNETIETFYAKLGKNQSSAEEGAPVAELEGVFLQTDIKEIAVSPSKTSIFSIIPDTKGSIGTISLPDGTKKSKMFSLPLKEFLVSWPKESTLLLETKPSGSVPGYAYTLDSKSGAFNKVLGDILGLTILANPTLSHIIYSESKQGKVFLNVLDIKKEIVAVTPFQTLPEKCVWSKKEKMVFYCAVPDNPVSGVYPDIWYQGSVSFSDKIWKINLETNATELVLDTTREIKTDVDATLLSFNEKENYLTFINKKDSSLWGIQLNPAP